MTWSAHTSDHKEPAPSLALISFTRHQQRAGGSDRCSRLRHKFPLRSQDAPAKPDFLVVWGNGLATARREAISLCILPYVNPMCELDRKEA